MIQLTMINLMIKMISLLSRFLLTSKLSIIGGALLSACRKEKCHNQRFILTQMHRHQHNGTRNALCCHRRPDNLHDFSVSAQQFPSRIIHSSFDLDGRHSTASHSSGWTSTSVDPKLFLHLHQSRILFIPIGEECSQDIISFSLVRERKLLSILVISIPCNAPILLHTRRSSERIATLINQSRRTRDKSPCVIY